MTWRVTEGFYNLNHILVSAGAAKRELACRLQTFLHTLVRMKSWDVCSLSLTFLSCFLFELKLKYAKIYNIKYTKLTKTFQNGHWSFSFLLSPSFPLNSNCGGPQAYHNDNNMCKGLFLCFLVVFEFSRYLKRFRSYGYEKNACQILSAATGWS